MTTTHVPRSAAIPAPIAPSNVEVSFRLIIEAARADALGSGAAKYQRIDGSRPWAMDEVGSAPGELGDSAVPRAGLLALLHVAPSTATRA